MLNGTVANDGTQKKCNVQYELFNVNSAEASSLTSLLSSVGLGWVGLAGGNGESNLNESRVFGGRFQTRGRFRLSGFLMNFLFLLIQSGRL